MDDIGETPPVQCGFTAFDSTRPPSFLYVGIYDLRYRFDSVYYYYYNLVQQHIKTGDGG